MGEANMDSSSDSEPETAEDMKNHAEAIRRADTDSRAQISSGKESKKKSKRAKVMHHTFA